MSSHYPPPPTLWYPEFSRTVDPLRDRGGTMKDQDTTNGQRISELESLRRKVSELEESEARLKRTERLLRESEERFRLLYEHAPLGYQSLDENGHFIEVNQAWLDTLGYLREEVIGKWFGDFLAPGYQEHFKINFPKFKAAGEIHWIEFDMLRKDGSQISVAFDGQIGRDEQGRFRQTHCILHDITQRKKTEEALNRANQEWERTFNAISDGIMVLDDQHKIIRANRAMADALGMPERDLIGKLCYELVHGETAPPVFCPHSQLLADGEEHSAEVVEPRLGATLDVRVSPILDQEGQVRGSVHVIRDITERKRVEDALRESEELHRITIGNIRDTVLITDDTDAFTYVCPNTQIIFGYSTEEVWALGNITRLMGHNLFDRSQLESREEIQNIETTITDKGGQEHTLLVNVKRVDIKGGTILYTCRDITKRKKAEEALHRLNRELQAIKNCNQTVLRAEDEQTLLNEVCRIICDEAGYRLAWVGYAENDAAKTIRPVAWAGFDSEYIAEAKLSWSDDTERGRGPAGIVIRSGETVCVQDFTTDPRMVPWRESALQRGYRSGIALPLKDESAKVFGALLIYHSESNIITPDEIHLMEELADDLAYGVNTLRNRIERKKTEEALRSSEDKYKAVVENIQIGISLLSPNLEVVDINKVFEQYFPRVRPGSGQICYEQYNDPPGSEPCSYCPCVLTLQDGKVHEAITETPSGPGIRNFHVISSPIKDSDGHIQFVIEMVEDITERKRVEEALQDSEERLRMTLEASQIGIWDWDVKTDQWCASPIYYTMLGYEPKAGLGDRSEWLERVHPDDRAFVKATIQGVLDGTFTEYQYEARLRHADGTYRWQHVQGMSVQRDENGKVTRLLGIRMDVDQRRRSEDALQAASRYNRTLIEASLDPLVTISLEGKITDVNAGTERVTGYSRNELIGTDFADYFTDPERAQAGYQQAFRDGSVKDYELEIRHKDGQLTPVMYNASLYRDESGNILGVFAAARDITDRKRAEEKTMQLAAIVESSDDAIIGKNLDGIITSWNKGAEKIYGYKDTEVLGKPISLLAPPHRQDEIPQLLDRMKRGEHVEHYETLRRRKVGHVIEVSLAISPIQNVDGRIIGSSAIARDITEQKNLQRQLLHSQKMEAVGTLAGGVAHDFNNLLTVIQGFSELLLLEMDVEAPGYSDLLKIQESALRGAELVRNLLAFSRKAETSPRPINLNHEVTRIEKLLSRTIPKMIKIVLHLEGDLAAVNADPDQMCQVLMNLAVNAEQAMPDGGNLTIATANISLDEGYCRWYPEVHPGAYVLVTVSDTGHGMQKEILEHIFEPFFTTKGAGKGTGLGLAMVYGIVRQHGGHITCDSEPNEGSTFKIYLPAIEEARTEKEGGEAQPLPPGGTETILLVDDEDFVRDLGVRFLTRVGYTALTAASGPEAVQLYLKEAERISLVILDLIMPEMGGDKCLEEILAINPDAKIVISSGAVVEDKKRETLEYGARGFISKPFRLRDMLKTVREVLDSA